MKIFRTLLLAAFAILATSSLSAQETLDTICGANTDRVQICLGNVCSETDAEICVPAFVGQFDTLAGLQFRIQFDTTKLAYTRFTTGNTRLQNGSTILSPGEGLVSVSWNDPDLTGLTFPANEPAFTFCFNVLDTGATQITFFDPGVTLRAFDVLGSGVAVTSSPGSVNQNCDSGAPTCDDGTMNGDETGVDCGGSCDPCTTSTTSPDDVDRRFTIHPNPISDRSVLRVDLGYSTQAQLDLLDLGGRLISRKSLVLRSGKLNLPLNANNFPGPGAYLIRLTTDREQLSRKVVR